MELFLANRQKILQNVGFSPLVTLTAGSRLCSLKKLFCLHNVLLFIEIVHIT